MWRPWIFLFVVLSLFIVAGNILALVVFLVAKPLPYNVRCLLINLAFADLLVGVLAIPMYIYLIVASFTGNLPPDSATSVVYTVIDIFAAFGSIFSLVAIAIDRLRAVAWPINHQNTTGLTYHIALVLIWLGAGIIAVLFILQDSKDIHPRGFFIPMIVCFFLTVVVILAAYSYLWYAVTQIRIDQAGGSRTIEKQLGLTFLLVTVLFIAMWVPFQVLNILVHIVDGKCHLFDCKFELIAFAKLFHYGNSLVNPLIYSFRIPGFRKAAVQLFCRRNARSQGANNATMNTYNHQEANSATLTNYGNAGYNAYDKTENDRANAGSINRYENPGFQSEPREKPWQDDTRNPRYEARNPNFNPTVSPGREADTSQPSMFI